MPPAVAEADLADCAQALKRNDSYITYLPSAGSPILGVFFLSFLLELLRKV